MSPGFVWPLQFVFNLASFCNLGDRTAPRAPRDATATRTWRPEPGPLPALTCPAGICSLVVIPRRTACAGLVENSANAPWPPRPRSGQRAQGRSGGAGPAHAVRTAYAVRPYRGEGNQTKDKNLRRHNALALRTGYAPPGLDSAPHEPRATWRMHGRMVAVESRPWVASPRRLAVAVTPLDT